MSSLEGYNNRLWYHLSLLMGEFFSFGTSEAPADLWDGVVQHRVSCLHNTDVVDYVGTIHLLFNSYCIFGHHTDDRILLFTYYIEWHYEYSDAALDWFLSSQLICWLQWFSIQIPSSKHSDTCFEITLMRILDSCMPNSGSRLNPVSAKPADT